MWTHGPGEGPGRGAQEVSVNTSQDSTQSAIEMVGVSTHNLKNIDVRVPHGALTVISGVSGSGKSSLAFDTLYAEGQRRFLESLSTYARQFLQRMEKPPIERVRQVLPAVALQQKNTVKNARSTVATLTELSDHLQLVLTHVGVTTCPACREIVRRDSPDAVARALEQDRQGHRLLMVADVPVLEIQTPQQVLDELVTEGYQRIYFEGEVLRLGEAAVEALLSQRSFGVVVDRVKVAPDDRLRLREAIEAGFRVGDGRLRVIDVEGEVHHEQIFQTTFACNGCGRVFLEPTPQLFSYNSPLGACPECSGFGRVAGLDMDKVVPDRSLTLEQGAVAPFESEARAAKKRRLLEVAIERGIPIDLPFGKLRAEDREFLLEGGKGFMGVRGYFEQLAEQRQKPQSRILVARYRGYTRCPACKGERFAEAAQAVTLGGKTIGDIYKMTLREALPWCEALPLTEEERARVSYVLAEVVSRLRYLNQVGLGYLSLGRTSRTLSGGEVQRIHLTASLGRMLTDTLYVLDEPTAGLHARDTAQLLEVMRGLRDIGNAVVVVEHDPDIIRGADWVLELGPRGGEHGGELMFQGTVAALREAQTPTGEAVRKTWFVSPEALQARRFDPARDPHLRVVGASENNLRDLTAAIPLGRLVCVTGVSGSGKSTLVHRCLFDGWRRATGDGNAEPCDLERLEGLEQIGELILMEQGGLTRSSRSNLATYTKAWDGIRKLYGGLRQARELGLDQGAFSFNRPGGRCEKCEGTGTLLVEMHFMADIEVVCDDCEGRRFRDEVLTVRYKDRHIADVLQMTVGEAQRFFQGTRGIVPRLYPLEEVGLDYLRLGQTTDTLSGGEAQRLLLASYLGRPRPTSSREQLLFIFDEPTIGLHLKDIEVLVRALRRIVAEGHSVLVVEHNIDFIAQADYLLDLGPEGGDGGGRLVACGAPIEVAACAESWTGRFLREALGEGGR
jgi:excinuclease ABC subunit A